MGLLPQTDRRGMGTSLSYVMAVDEVLCSEKSERLCSASQLTRYSTHGTNIGYYPPEEFRVSCIPKKSIKKDEVIADR